MATKRNLESQSETVINIDLKVIAQPVATVLASIVIAIAIVVHGGLTGGTIRTNTTGGTTGSTTSSAAPTVTAGSTTIDDDPILGNKDGAKVAIVEFSDYECPFCERFWQQTLPQIKSNYIDTGKVILVYRDLPLTSIHPNAQRYANAVNCALDQGGATAYYKMHDAVFGAVTAGELSNSRLGDLAAGVGLNKADLENCIASNKYDAEINADASAATAAGINGTPGFVVGILNADGTVTGEVISGAQPFAQFQTIIDKYLAQ